MLRFSPDALEREKKPRLREETLNAIAKELHSNLDLHAVLQKITDIGTNLTLASFGAFILNSVEEGDETFFFYTLSGAPREAFENFYIPSNSPLLAPIMEGPCVIRVNDVLQDASHGFSPLHSAEPFGHLPVRSYLAVPVVLPGGQVLGGLLFGHPDACVFDESAERVAQGIADQAALAVENARLYYNAKKEIEHRVRAECAYRESEGRFEQLAVNAPVAIFIKDLEGRYTLANPLACEALGRSDVKGLRDDQLLDKTSAEGIRRHDLEVMKSGSATEYEERVQRGVFWQDYLAVKFPFFDANGEVKGVCGVATDITERRRALEELDRSREENQRQTRLHEAILGATPDFVYVFDLNCRFTYANEALLQEWGRTWDESIGKKCIELGYPDWHAAMHERELKEVISTKRPLKGEIPFTGTHGTRVYEYIFVPVLDSHGEVEAVAGYTRDVTDRKEVEEGARKEQERYHQLVESLPAAVYTCDLEGRLELFNEAAIKLWGRVPEVGKDLWCGSLRLFNLDGTPLPLDQCPMALTLKQRRIVKGQEILIERPDGTRVNVIPHPQPLYDNSGRIVGGINMLLDVTEQRRAEGDRALLAAIVSSSDDAIFSTTLEGLITSWNAGAERIFGYTADEAIGQSMMMIVPDDRQDEATELLSRICRGERIEHFETIRIARNGTRFDISLSVSPIRDSIGRIVGSSRVARNISDRIHARHALRESEERFRILANHAPVGIFQTDLAGETTFVNEAWCQLAGMKKEEARGDGWSNAIHPEDRERVLHEWQQAYELGLPSHTEFRFRRPDGGVIWLQGCAEPLRDPQGKMQGYIGTVADITSRKLAEQAISENERRIVAELAGMRSLHKLTERLLATDNAESALREVLTSIVDLQNANLGCVYLYDELTESFRIVAQHNFPPAALDRFIDTTFDENSACGRALAAGKRVVIEDVDQDRDYKSVLPFAHEVGYRAIQSTPLMSRGGSLLGMLSTHFREPRKFAPHELWLLDLFARQAADFVEQMQLINSMREADHRKDEFLAMLAHELRNPLAPVRSGLDFLTMEETEPNEVVAIMRDQVEHLVRLVDDLLDVSRIAQGKVELRKEIVAVAPLVERAVDSVAWTFKNKDQSLVISVPRTPIYLHADPVRLVQVLGNLLNNASKYTPEGGHIELSVFRQDDQVTLQVKDNGIGIERDLLPRVFDLFTQSTRALDRAQGGIGIGLTLVRSLIELHSGSVSAESEGVGKGSRFVVRLPISEHSPSTKTRRQRSPSQPRRILVVDDNFGAARLVSILLRKLGNHEVEMAHDGPSAIEKVASFQPDLVLLDIGLPGMDGYVVARHIRSLEGRRQPFLVALTGYGRPEDLTQSKAAGFDEHLVKPPSVEMLESLLADPRIGDIDLCEPVHYVRRVMDETAGIMDDRLNQ